MQNDPRLHSRLRNCLQTILDLEPDLERLQITQVLSNEFTMLKGICERLETIRIQEDDVQRIENATAHFLSELKGPMENASSRPSGQRTLQ